MSRCTLVLVAIGLACASNRLFAEKAAIEPLRVVQTNCAAREGLSISPDGRSIDCFDSSWRMHRIDLNNRGTDKTLSLPREFHGEKIHAAIHVQDEVWLLALGRYTFQTKEDGFETRFILYDFAADKTLADWAAHKGVANRLVTAPKQKWLVTADYISDDMDVLFWDRKTLEKVGRMDLRQEFHLRKGDGVMLEGMAVDPTSSFLAFCLTGGMVRVWDLEKKTWRPVVDEEDRICPSICFLDGGALALGYSTLTVDFLGAVRGSSHVNVYDWKAGKLLFRANPEGGLSDVTGSPDGRLMALGESRGDGIWVSLWDVAGRREVVAFKAYAGGMCGMIFTPDGKKIVTCGRDGMIKVWDVEAIVANAHAK